MLLTGSTLLTLFLSTTALLPQDKDKKDPTLTIGDTVPAVQISHWLKGKKFSKKKAPESFVITFVAADETGKEVFATLRKIAKDFKDSGLKVLAVLPPVQNLPLATARSFIKASAKKARFTVGLDKEGRSRKAWLEPMLAKELPHSVIVMEGRIVWEGQPGDVLYDNVEGALEGRIDLGEQWVLRNRIAARPFGMALLSQDFDKATQIIVGILTRFPTSAHLLSLKYVALRRTQDGKRKSVAFVKEALPRLREKNGHAAIMWIMKLFDEPKSAELTNIALATLVTLSGPEEKFASDALSIQVMLLDQQKKHAQALAMAKTTYTRFKEQVTDLHTLTSILVGSKNIEHYKDLLLAILETRVVLDKPGEDRDDALYFRWQVLAYVSEDKDAARKAARMALEQMESATPLNGIIWALLTEEGYGQDYLDLALLGVARMLKAPDLGYNELDTAALAYFKKGDKARAISLQEQALKLAKAEEYIDESTLEEFEAKLKEYTK